jgi:hypothetical protein
VLEIGPKLHCASSEVQIKFLELSGTEKKACHESKVKDVTMYGTSLLSLWRHLPPQGLRAAIAATGPGLVIIFYFNYS